MEATATKTEAGTAGTGGAQSWVDRLWSSILERAGFGSGGDARAEAPPDGATGEAAAAVTALPPLERTKRLAEALLSERGEASGAAVARELLTATRELDAAGRAELYRFLAGNFGPEPARLRAAAEAWLAAPTADHAGRLADAAEPPRQELLRRMNMTLGGTAALVAARREVLGRLREEPVLKPLDSDLKHLLGSWFNRGFLELRRIDWQTPAAVLEKLIEYEAVHEIQGWDDLRRRLAADRRCFGFFHPALPGRAADLRRGRAGGGPGLGRAAAARARRGVRGHRRSLRGAGGYGDLLFHLELPGGLAGHLLRELPDQAGGGGVEARAAALAALCDPFAGAGLPALVGRAPCLGRHGDRRRPAAGRGADAGARGRRRWRGGRIDRGVAQRPLVGGPGPGGGAARAADAPLRGVPHGGQWWTRTARPGGALPPRQRRPAGADQLARQHRPARDPGILRRDGELPLRPRLHRGEPRGLRAQRDRRALGVRWRRCSRRRTEA